MEFNEPYALEALREESLGELDQLVNAAEVEEITLIEYWRCFGVAVQC